MNTKTPQPGEGRLVPRHDDPSTKLPPPPPQPERTDYGTPPPPPHPKVLEVEKAFQEVPLDQVRYIHAGGLPTDDQLAHAQGSALFVEGEMLNLVWVNQDDIRRLGVRFDMPENCPECGRPNERPEL